MSEIQRPPTDTRPTQKEVLQPTIPLGIVGAAGPTGELFAEALHDMHPVGVIKPGQAVNHDAYPTVIDSVTRLLQMSPQYIIVATEHSAVEPVLHEISTYYVENGWDSCPNAIVVTANGILRDVFEDAQRRLPLVRGLLYTAVPRDSAGHLKYDHHKLRIDLGATKGVLTPDDFNELKNVFRRARFTVSGAYNYQGAEAAKQLANSLAGGAAAVTGLPNHAVYRNSNLARYEVMALTQRRAVLEKDGVTIDPPPWFKLGQVETLYRLAQQPGLRTLALAVLAYGMRKQRGDDPSSTWTKLEANRPTEIDAYLGSFAKAGILIDEAALEEAKIYQKGKYTADQRAHGLKLAIQNAHQRQLKNAR